jgi:general secretion pathway protein G
MNAPAEPKQGIPCVLWAALYGVLSLIAFSGFSMWFHNLMEEKRKACSHLGCRSVAMAVEAYIHNEANKNHEFPRTLDDLIHPPFGGPPFLRNGNEDLLDCWGKPYEMERVRKADGTEYVLVKTTAPDGTSISQFGIGPSAQPKR